VSTAVRAHETWEAFSSGAEIDLAADLDAGLYAAGPDAAIEILRAAPADAPTVMFVGHNPTMAQLVHLLYDGSADPAAFGAVVGDFPTSAVAVLEVPGEWSDLEIGCARLTDAHVGRG
jgi:phosphohistidine phosphatase